MVTGGAEGIRGHRDTEMLKVILVASCKANCRLTGWTPLPLPEKPLNYSNPHHPHPPPTPSLCCPLPQNTHQDSLYFVLHGLTVEERRKLEVRHKIPPSWCDYSGLKCQPGAPELLPWQWQDSPPGQMHLPGERQSIYRGSEGLQGSMPRSGTRLGDDGEYLRNGTSEPLEKGGRLPGLSTP